MKYCQYCGAQVEDRDVFCHKCGRTLNKETARAKTEPLEKLGCELAYAGTLFFLPLILCPQEKNAKYCANQGLWVLILSVAACSSIRILGAINAFFAGSIIGILVSGVYSLSFMVFLFFMLYLIGCCVRNAYAIHRNEELRPILFADKIRILK